MNIAILALQGAFVEHQKMLHRLGVESVLIRNLSDWQEYLKNSPLEGRGAIIPGGESTAMSRIMRDEQLEEPIREAILNGMPVLGTCAGLIMLDRNHLNTMNITAHRNAYGRQLGSFNTISNFVGLEGAIPMTFIRAPYIEDYGEDVEVLAEVDNRIVAARQGNQLVTAFHPELTDDTRVHQLFVESLSSHLASK